MPFWMGAMGSHDDSNHQGSAKRDTAEGLAGLDAGGDVLASGPSVELTRDGNGDIFIIERTSGETVMALRRTGANAYSLYNNTVAGGKVLQDSSMKNAASGIPGLDASSLIALSQLRTNFFIGTTTRDTSTASGNQAINGVGFQPRLVIISANVPTTSEVSIGFSDGTNHYSLINNHGATANAWTVATANAVSLNTTGAILAYGTISMGADGFTIAWTKVGAKTGTANIHYICIK